MSTATTIEPSELLLTPVRVVAEFQLFGEAKDGEPLDGEKWMFDVLLEAQKAGLVTNFDVTKAYPGPFELQLVQFYVDILVEDNVERDQAKELGESLLGDHILRDQVDVRWATFLDKDKA